MGMFSWDCDHCGHPLIAPFNIQKHNSWMADAVALLPNGALMKGDYDGYGRINGTNIHDDGEPQVFHIKCWEAVGKPDKFKSSSRSAADQGHFYGEEEHDSPPPGEPGFFHADAKRPKATCPRCGRDDARQWDAFHFKCKCSDEVFVPPTSEEAAKED